MEIDVPVVKIPSMKKFAESSSRRLFKVGDEVRIKQNAGWDMSDRSMHDLGKYVGRVGRITDVEIGFPVSQFGETVNDPFYIVSIFPKKKGGNLRKEMFWGEELAPVKMRVCDEFFIALKELYLKRGYFFRYDAQQLYEAISPPSHPRGSISLQLSSLLRGLTWHGLIVKHGPIGGKRVWAFQPAAILTPDLKDFKKVYITAGEYNKLMNLENGP